MKWLNQCRCKADPEQVLCTINIKINVGCQRSILQPIVNIPSAWRPAHPQQPLLGKMTTPAHYTTAAGGGGWREALTMDSDWWRSHIPLPHILNTVVRLLKSDKTGIKKEVSQEQLEELLPHLCLALPSCSSACADLLLSLPNDSSVWNELEKALTDNKLLHPEVSCVLYLSQQLALERELMRVLSLYVGSECQGAWWDDATLSMSHFRPHGAILTANPTAREEQDCAEGLAAGDRKVNVWKSSPVAEATGYSDELFHRCLSFLARVLRKTRFSFPAVIASRDYLAQVSHVMENDMYQSFPSDLSHIAYLLSLPLAMKQEQLALRKSLLRIIQNTLREELIEGGEMGREKVCVMLSLFSFWLPLLRESGFLNAYLSDSECDIFCSSEQGR